MRLAQVASNTKQIALWQTAGSNRRTCMRRLAAAAHNPFGKIALKSPHAWGTILLALRMHGRLLMRGDGDSGGVAADRGVRQFIKQQQ